MSHARSTYQPFFTDRPPYPRFIRLNLQSWLPPHLFKPINHVLVGFGQVVCLPIGPRCDVCLLAREKICPSRVTNGNYKGRKPIEVNFDSDTEVDIRAAPKIEIKMEQD